MLRRILDSPWLYFGLAAVLVVAGVLSQVEVRLPSRPTGTVADVATLRERRDLNVIFVLIDTLRADHLSSYGYPRPTSPFMDSMAKNGIRFSTVEAQSSWTKTSMASLWTALWPHQTGVLRWDQSIPETARMPAEILKDAGFRTAGIYRNGWVSPKFGFAQGFDVYVKPFASVTPAKFERHNPSSSPLQGSDADATEGAFEFLRSYGQERFFLYLHLMDVHQYAYDVTTTTFGTSSLDAYDSAIAWVDTNLSVLATKLQELDLLDETILVVASDHGESFGEHGVEGHGQNLYQEVTAVPLLISLPFALEEGVVVEDLVSNADIMPTILDLVGLPPMEGVTGRSLVPAVEAAARGERPAPAQPVFAQLDRTWGMTEHAPKDLVSVRNERWKLLRWMDDSRPLQLFDLENDPKELVNLATKEAGPRDELDAKIAAYRAMPLVFGAAPTVEVDSAQLEQLRALGYIIK